MAGGVVKGAGLGLTSDRARARMVEALRGNGVRHEAVLAAMATVPRHQFIDQAFASRAYEDVALPIGQGQTISKPSIVARMIELLTNGRPASALRHEKVLEIGTGCGYQAAVLSHVFGQAISVERIRWLHDSARIHLLPLQRQNLRLVFGDGRIGVPAAAPYDGIILAAAGDAIPDDLLLQMKVGGRLVAPVLLANGRQQALHQVDRRADQDWSLTVLDAVRFVPLRPGTN
jgi:protein-L-isoaspartate(D-aspartate) O-methyltransferase